MKSITSLFLGVFFLLSTSTAIAKNLAVGSLGSDPAEQIELFQPLADYLANKLGKHGIHSGRVAVGQDIPSMAALMRQGQVDIFIDSPYPGLSVSELTKGQIRLRRWKKGSAEYDSVILVRADDDIGNLGALRGKTLAFEEPFSTTGYFLPKLELLKAGLPIAPREEAKTSSTGDKVSYLFAGDLRSSLAQLLWKRVDAIAMGSNDYAALSAHDKDSVRVIHRSAALPRHVVVLRDDLDKPLADAICDILKDMERTEEGRRVLAKFEKTTRFDDIPPGARKTLMLLRNEIRREMGKQRGQSPR